MTQQTDSAERTMNPATSPPADPVTTQYVPATRRHPRFLLTPPSQSASCRLHNQNIQAARCVTNGARRDRTRLAILRSSPTVPLERPWVDACRDYGRAAGRAIAQT